MFAANTTLHSQTTTTTATVKQDSGLGVIILCALIILLVCVLLGVGAFVLMKRTRERRKNHGEYRPQQEEAKHAKDLPYITPPNIEGLI